MWKPEIRLALILLKTPQSKHNGVVSYVFICYREWLSNNNRKQSNSNRTQSNSNRTQSNKITQSNAIETNQRFPVMFDWCSIVFGNRTSIVRLGSIDFDFSIEKSGSIVFDWHRLVLLALAKSYYTVHPTCKHEYMNKRVFLIKLISKNFKNHSTYRIWTNSC